MAGKLSSKLFNLLKKTTCTVCSRRYASVEVESDNYDPFSKICSLMNQRELIMLFIQILVTLHSEDV